MSHHTKDKGDLGVAKAICDLCEQGWLVLSPMTEHAPFDLVIYKDGVFQRIQVKYRSTTGTSLRAALKNTWYNANGMNKSNVSTEEIDIICMYSPEMDKCYYIRTEPDQIEYSIPLKEADSYRDIPVLPSLDGRGRKPKPWYWKDRKKWAVTINGTRHMLESDKGASYLKYRELLRKTYGEKVL